MGPLPLRPSNMALFACMCVHLCACGYTRIYKLYHINIRGKIRYVVFLNILALTTGNTETGRPTCFVLVLFHPLTYQWLLTTYPMGSEYLTRHISYRLDKINQSTLGNGTQAKLQDGCYTTFFGHYILVSKYVFLLVKKHSKFINFEGWYVLLNRVPFAIFIYFKR